MQKKLQKETMKIQKGHIAVVTGGGSGMGRELCIALAKKGVSVAFCDLNQESIEETIAILSNVSSDENAKFFGTKCDVRFPDTCKNFAEDVSKAFNTTHVNLVFNNAGLGGFPNIFKKKDDALFDFILDVDLHGVINITRAFIDLLANSDKGALINTASVCGFHASAGTAYSVAKFAVKGFSEGLIKDFQDNAPHLNVHCVMPGFVSTNIDRLSAVQGYTVQKGRPPTEQLVNRWKGKTGQNNPDNVRIGLPAPDAAKIILNGVENDQWAILVGDDAVALDKGIRSLPLGAAYPLGKLSKAGNISTKIAKLGDPTYYVGRQSQLKKSNL